MANHTAQTRSDTIPTRISTISSASIKSKRILLYDMAENTTRKMSRDEFDHLYSGIAPEFVSILPLPKGASYVDISPDDLKQHSPEYDRCWSPEPISDSLPDSPTEFSGKSYSSSTQASVKIPWSVFLHRGFDPKSYTELIIVTRPSPGTSQISSRSNTSQANTFAGTKQ